MSNWQPSAGLAALQARAELYRRIRSFFAERNYLEIEPPLLGRGGTTDPAIESFSCEMAGETFYLQTSPEFAMKRMLAAGSGSIFAICKVFRKEEQGRYHNPEFSMLEWYRLGFDDHELMQEVGDLLSGLLDAPVQKKSYRQLFEEHLGLDPHTATAAELEECAHRHVESSMRNEPRDLWLDLLFSHCIQPRLSGITLVHDYPASQAALARITPDAQGQDVARRFEAFFDGTELANGYWELTDAEEQAQRFAADNEKRRANGQVQVNHDRRLIEALQAGLPDCAGVALGLDRLLMLMTGASHLEEVLTIAWSRL